jgi:hypothetical protein
MPCERCGEHSLRLLAHRGLFLLFHVRGSVRFMSWSGIGYLHDMEAGCILGCGLGFAFVTWDHLLGDRHVHVLMSTGSIC